MVNGIVDNAVRRIDRLFKRRSRAGFNFGVCITATVNEHCVLLHTAEIRAVNNMICFGIAP